MYISFLIFSAFWKWLWTFPKHLNAWHCFIPQESSWRVKIYVLTWWFNRTSVHIVLESHRCIKLVTHIIFSVIDPLYFYLVWCYRNAVLSHTSDVFLWTHSFYWYWFHIYKGKSNFTNLVGVFLLLSKSCQTVLHFHGFMFAKVIYPYVLLSVLAWGHQRLMLGIGSAHLLVLTSHILGWICLSEVQIWINLDHMAFSRISFFKFFLQLHLL